MFKSIQSESMIKNTHHFKSFKVNVSLPTKPTGPRKKQNIENCDLDQIPNHQKRMYDVYYLFTQADQRMFHSSLHSSRQFFDGTRQALFPALAFFSRNFLKISMTFWI